MKMRLRPCIDAPDACRTCVTLRSLLCSIYVSLYFPLSFAFFTTLYEGARLPHGRVSCLRRAIASLKYDKINHYAFALSIACQLECLAFATCTHQGQMFKVRKFKHGWAQNHAGPHSHRSTIFEDERCATSFFFLVTGWLCMWGGVCLHPIRRVRCTCLILGKFKHLLNLGMFKHVS